MFVLDTGGAVYAATLTTSVAVFAAASTFAVLRYRTVEVDVVLRRAFIVAGVAGASLIVFLAIFLLADLVVGPSLGAIGGTVAVALVGVPLRNGVGRRVGLLLYGHRDPVKALAQVSDGLDLAGQPAEVLPGLARAFAEALGATGVLIEPTPELGLPPGGTGTGLSEPVLERGLHHRGRLLGRLLVGSRAPGEEYGPADIALIEILVRQIAPALEALKLAAELQHSREGIATRAKRSDAGSGVSSTTGSVPRSQV